MPKTSRNDEYGDLYMWGDNSTYQLGDGTTSDATSPTKLGSSTWLMVSCGYTHTAAIDSDGFLWTWGEGSNGKLGNGAVTDETTPYKVGTDKWVYVSCGGSHTLAIKSDGTLWSCGLNTNGQLGDGTTTQRTSLVQVDSQTWYKVSAGEFHSAAINSKGGLFTWGNYSDGRLGLGSSVVSDVLSPFAASTSNTYRDISCGYAHTMGITYDKVLMGTGLNANGQLGNGSTATTDVFDRTSETNCNGVSAGAYHSLALLVSGKTTEEGIHRMWSTGYNSNGQLGTGDLVQVTNFIESELENSSPYLRGRFVEAGRGHSLYIRSEEEPP